MKTPLRFLAATLFGLLAFAPAQAAVDLSGQWAGEVTTPMGQLKLILTFQVDGEKLTGKSSSEFGGEKRETPLQGVKLANDTLTFAETIDMQGASFRIDYTGKVSATEIKFTRQIGDFGNDEYVAKRVVKEPAAPPALANPPTGKQK